MYNTTKVIDEYIKPIARNGYEINVCLKLQAMLPSLQNDEEYDYVDYSQTFL